MSIFKRKNLSFFKQNVYKHLKLCKSLKYCTYKMKGLHIRFTGIYSTKSHTVGQGHPKTFKLEQKIFL